jgi:carboxylesterase type B
MGTFSSQGDLLTVTFRFPTRDGTLLPYRGLPLSGPLAESHNIPILLGYNRDEVSYMIPLGPTNFTFIMEQFTNLLGINLIPLANSSFSPERSPSWNTFTDVEKANAVFDASGKVLTSGLFKCPTTAFAFSAEKNNIFNPVYQFEFNRTYQPARFEDSARGFCGRDVDDPEHTEYYKCHAGEVPFTFGNIVSQGWRDRDGLDTRFAQLVVDYWTAFARTGTMKPEDGYLEARGYDQSRSKMEEGGAWKQSDEGAMVLQWGGLGLVELGDEQIGCKELGLAKDFYEHVDFGSI